MNLDNLNKEDAELMQKYNNLIEKLIPMVQELAVLQNKIKTIILNGVKK